MFHVSSCFIPFSWLTDTLGVQLRCAAGLGHEGARLSIRAGFTACNVKGMKNEHD